MTFELKSLLQELINEDEKNIWFFGGASIVKQALDFID